MQHILFCAGLLLTCLLGSSQSLQQLEQKLKQAKTDKDKIYVLDSISLYYTLLYQGSQDSMAIMYSKKAITIAEQSQDRELLALAYLNHGRHLFSSFKTFFL